MINGAENPLSDQEQAAIEAEMLNSVPSSEIPVNLGRLEELQNRTEKSESKDDNSREK